jgi:hypothetical protein
MTKPLPSTGMLSVYDGRRYLGAIIWRNREGFAAFDTEDRTLGFFKTREAAIAAVRAAAAKEAAP